MNHSDFLDRASLLEMTLEALRFSGSFEKIQAFTHDLYAGVYKGGKLIMYGNGGSAADCDHIIGEFRGRFLIERPSVNAISLSDSVATTTAIANDYGYEQLFRRQLDGCFNEHDSIIALTTSGTSKNIVNSIEGINGRFPDINSLIITGFVENEDYRNGLNGFKRHIEIPIPYIKKHVARIQEVTMFLLHCMCEMFDDIFTETHGV